MTVLKAINTNNGMAGAHRVVKAEIQDQGLQLQVHMYLTAEDAANNQNLRWQEYPVLPLAALDVQDPWGSLERGLVAQVGGLLEGGTFVADVAADDIGTAKAVKWAEIKAIRDQLECGGFDLAGVGRFDSDAESRARIVGASMAAKIARDAGQPYAINWTLADNTTVELDADAVINVGFALLAHVDSIHQRSRALYAEIQAAEDAQAVASISWSGPAPAPEPTPEQDEPVEA
ncbi:DUF4376 domain-containing protein [Comamonas sp. Tr-654]|uniref:DUF4376 domain-containing protein n=1 Tax=Comamonas sp. Tr-654 TaxID=2608341 RepID=UPI0014238921|nr:DUF4376 domain-containing protein [Comamonas sp. Tr-654]NIF85357.1 DUF4376 domain-containing protein [Comamonas sp. Tr-654]